MNIKIKENSLLAKIAARKMGSKDAAIVIGNTIHLFGATRKDLLDNPTWLRHELKHVEQTLRLGLASFLTLYLLDSIRNGYQNNRFEIEARNAESTPSILEKYLK